MRTYRHLLGILSLLLPLALVGPGCDALEELSDGAPTVSYPETTIDAEFYREGSSSAPSIDWNGAQGTISLGTDVEGLDVNSTTGRLTWTKLLPPGTHDVEVVVSNAGGQVVVPLTIENPLSGSFEGTYSGGSYFALDVEGDGTVAVRANSESDPTRGEGTWSVEGGSYVFEYVYPETAEEYYVVADLEQTTAAATLEGDWFFGTYTPGDSPGGTVSVSIE